MELPVRYRPKEDALYVGSRGPIPRTDVMDFFGPLEVLAPATLSALRCELKRYWRREGFPEASRERDPYSPHVRVAWSEEPPETFDDERSVMEQGELVLTRDGGLALDVTLFGIDAESLPEPALRSLLEPILRRRSAALVWAREAMTDPGPSWEVRIAPTMRGRTVGDVAELASDVVALADAASTGQVSQATAMDLLRAGQAELLIGLPESAWLEVKSFPYNLNQQSAKIELAQDVARFANSEDGGILVIGMRAKRRGDSEVIVALAPLEGPSQTQRYQRILDDRIVPVIDDLDVSVVPIHRMPGRHLLVVSVPKQPDALRPFLVHGAIVAGRVEGAFFSIVRRRGEQSVTVHPAAIHSLIAAGRAALNRPVGEEPGSGQRRDG